MSRNTMSRNKNRETVFRFKQFQIKNDISAMKVGTDGVLIGAWSDVANSKRIIDAGSGSGLISLMLAQRCGAEITGIEIDSAAYKESLENVNNSPWRDRISIINNDIINTDIKGVDHIVSNPPFFTNGITAPEKSRALARHCDTLNFKSLIKFAKDSLVTNGKLSFISTYEAKDEITSEAAFNGMCVTRFTNVISKPEKEMPVRILWELTKQCSRPILYDKLYIRNNDNTYSAEYIALTKDFYINM